MYKCTLSLLHVCVCIHVHNTTTCRRIINNIFTKMKENVGMLKPKKHVNKVGRRTYDLKLNKLLPYNPT